MVINKKNSDDPHWQRVYLAVQIKKEEGLLKELQEEYYERFGKTRDEIFEDRILSAIFISIWIASMFAILTL